MTAVGTGMRNVRSSRWLMPVLVGSLALNLIVVGAAGSLVWRSYFGSREVLGRRVVSSVIGYSVTLASERVKELERLTKEERQKVLPLRRALLEARAEVNRALTAQPFDEARFLAAQARLVEADQRSRESSFKLQVALSLHFTPEERLGYLRWREKQRPQNPLDVPEQPASEPKR
jgi:hypothetical protein